MSSETVDCAHCNGTGVCRAINQNKSCDYCMTFYNEKNEDIRRINEIVPCACCKGAGKRNLNRVY